MDFFNNPTVLSFLVFSNSICTISVITHDYRIPADDVLI